MKQFTIVANWKMHFGPTEAVSYTKKLKAKIVDHKSVTVVLAAPSIDLVAIDKPAIRGHLLLGAQDLNAKDEGANTGEISGPMVRQVAEYVIVGHSERRRDQKETDKQIAAKLAAAVRNDLKPILCVGEKLADRTNGHSTAVVVDQVTAALHGVTADDIKDLQIAYEPVWAIGTGEFCPPEHLSPVVDAIRHTVEHLYGEEASSRLSILYGGSVDPDNASAYLAVEGVTGLLVGGASLNAESFGSIVRAAQDEALK